MPADAPAPDVADASCTRKRRRVVRTPGARRPVNTAKAEPRLRVRPVRRRLRPEQERPIAEKPPPCPEGNFEPRAIGPEADAGDVPRCEVLPETTRGDLSTRRPVVGRPFRSYGFRGHPPGAPDVSRPPENMCASLDAGEPKKVQRIAPVRRPVPE